MKLRIVALTCCAAAGGFLCELEGHAATALGRISVEKAPGEPGRFFFRDTGATFHPKGFNHTVLEHGGSGWHATFNAGVYDPESLENTLAAMRTAGANTVRVWAWGVQKAGGFTDAPADLNPAYLDNFLDFLRRAARHDLRVIAILDETPQGPHYRATADAASRASGMPPLRGHNGQYLDAGLIAAKRACAADFVRHIRECAPELLPAVLAWSLANEVCVTFTAEPFSNTQGTVTTCTGKSYDMADRGQRQACYDESILTWANEIASGIKTIDPDALVTAGMWTADAHGRAPNNGLWPDDRDPRIPPRPSVLAGPGCRLDFIDVHVYPWDGTARIRRDAHERDAVMAGHIPAIVGEYGVFKDRQIGETRTMLREMVRQAYALGYIGDLHWVWDLTRVSGQTWSAVEEGLAPFLMQLPRRQ